ncbi:MAG: CAP domain-containing protein [Pyrinomonadaceae bacterium]
MFLSKLFPRPSIPRRARKALLLVACFGLSSMAAHATDITKPVARPVARLISTSAARQEIAVRSRPRVEARMVPASASYAPVPARTAIAVAASTDERRAFELINAERRARGFGPLTLDGQLVNLARYHSDNMAGAAHLSHSDSDGLDLSGRADLLGVHGWKAMGENIAYNQGYEDPVAFAVERWMKSDKHRDNILNGEYTHAGLGIARTADGQVFFTQVFMTR